MNGGPESPVRVNTEGGLAREVGDDRGAPESATIRASSRKRIREDGISLVRMGCYTSVADSNLEGVTGEPEAQREPPVQSGVRVPGTIP